MRKTISLLTMILGGFLVLITFSSCVEEKTETSIMYYNLLDASGNQVNVSVNTVQETPKSK